MTEEDFLYSMQDGKWFRVYNKYETVYAVKMKEIVIGGRKLIQSIWLSFRDPEAMCFSEYNPSDWSWSDGRFTSQSSGVYHFGSSEPSNANEDDCIYDENTGEIIESRLIKGIFDYSPNDFLTIEEFQEVWTKLKENIPLDFDILSYKE
jgi:hypothetical protein